MAQTNADCSKTTVEHKPWNQQFEAVMIKNEVVSDDEYDNEDTIQEKINEMCEVQIKQDESDLPCDFTASSEIIENSKACSDKIKERLNVLKRKLHCKIAKDTLKEKDKCATITVAVTETCDAHPQHKQKFKCDSCPRQFSRAYYLKSHKKIHSGEGLFTCEQCSKTFICSNHLEEHMKTHSREKPYLCTICEKRFSRTTHLKEHGRTHTGERPYKCPICNKGFPQSGQLLKHKRTHTGEKPYMCTVCGYMCSEAGSLKKHKRIHTGEKPYVCETCGFRFTESGSLRKHVNNVHKWLNKPQ